ncbi:MAG: Yop proteins translocation protein U [Chlamydiae bacterium]|nr:Yop proteins translocation protein U [Chlamydiota bacterium]
MAEKTEKATPKKLRDARKKGQVAKSQDLPSAFTFIVSISLVIGFSGYLYDKVGSFIISAFTLVPHDDLYRLIPIMYKEGIMTIFTAVIPIMAIVAMVGVIVNFLAVGPVFSVEVFKFDIKKFDPVQNLKAKFKMKTLVELIKSIVKISVAAYLIYGVVYKSLPVLTKAVTLPMSGALLIFHAFLMEVVLKVGLFFIAVAILDFAYQKYNFGKEMMMEKFEVKQEYKNTEGDPQIKGKRKQIAQEIAYSQGPAGGVQKAAAVVTNPVHLAIAIGYNREIDAAPYILAMGEGILAERITKYAEEYEIPVIRNIKLANELWQNGEIYEYVPEDTYEAMAEILRWISSLEEEYDFDQDIDYDEGEEEKIELSTIHSEKQEDE